MDPSSTTVVIILAVLASPGLGILLTKYIRPKATLPERLASEEADNAKLRIQLRLRDNYISDLRADAYRHKHEPVDWPEEMTK